MEPGLGRHAGGAGAVREHPGRDPEPTVWPLQNAEVYTLIWAAVIVAIFAPLSVRRYERMRNSR